MNRYQNKFKLTGACCLGIGLMLSAGAANAAEYWLCADVTTQTMPDTGEVVTMWGFAADDNSNLADGCGGAVQVPGPMLTVPAGDANLTINVANNLPNMNGAPVPVSIVIPGQVTPMSPVHVGGRVRSFTHETLPGVPGTYIWNNFKPGTYLYHSGTHPAVQVQMGLYGGATKNAAVGQAYPGLSYDSEAVVFYSEIDPALHQAVATDNYGPGKAVTSTIGYQPKYFLVNGQPYSTGTPPPPLTVASNGRLLVRSLNAGLETHVPVLQGREWEVIAEDGNVYPYVRPQYSMALPALKTRDAIVDLDCSVDGTSPAPANHAVYDRRLRLTNAAFTGGGMLSYLSIADSDNDGIADICDNCTMVANGPAIPDAGGNSQRDTDGDGYGNICDPDFNGNNIVDPVDFQILKLVFGSPVNPDQDLNGNGVVDPVDFGILKSRFGQPPGPSGRAP